MSLLAEYRAPVTLKSCSPFLSFFLIAFALFIAFNIFAAGVLGLGIIVLVALWLRRKAEFWPLLGAMALFFGGAGALGCSYGAYFGAMLLWVQSIWPFVSWVLGFALGGIGGVLVGVFGVALKRRHELPVVETELRNRFRALKSQFSRLGFRQTLRVGAYSLRVALMKRAA